MRQSELINLCETIAVELQARYTTADINIYLTRLGVSGATERSVSSKRLYVKELLSKVTEDVVRRVAEDMGLINVAAVGSLVGSEPTGAGDLEPYAFVSYQHEDRSHAAEIKRLLKRVDVPAFLAHEDIEVSVEWRTRLLDELNKVTIFVAVLTKRYFKSIWCVQESGIAVFRRDLVIMPLSFDGTVPEGFLGQFQSRKVYAGRLDLRDLAPGFVRSGGSRGMDVAIRVVRQSTNYRDAEANFELIWPYRSLLSDGQIKALLEAAAANDQVSNASKCVREFIPMLLRSHGGLLDADSRKSLVSTCSRYDVIV